MKKLFLFISSLILFFGCFWGLRLDSYALVTVDPNVNGFSNGVLKYDYNYNGFMSVYEYDFTENSAYNRFGMCCYYINGYYNDAQQNWCIVNVLDLLNGINNAQEPFGYADYSVTRIEDDYLYTDSNIAMISNGQNSSNDAGHFISVWTNTAFTTDFPVFASKEKAVDYFRYGLLDDESIKYGENYLNFTSYTEQVYDPIQIPAPHMEWVTDANGAFTHKLHFLNNGYFGEHNTQLNYGLLFYMHWNSVGGGTVTLNSTNAFSQDYQFTITDYIMSEQVGIYSTPALGSSFNFDDYKCPPYLDLDTNGLSVNNFNSLLSTYPISNRNLTFEQGFNNAQSVLNQIKTGLSSISYSYNAPVVAAQYFVIDENNHMIKGPISKMTIKIPNPSYFNNMGLPTTVQPSEDQDFNPETDQPISPPVVINPPGAENPGIVNPYPVPDYDNVDASNLVDNMGSLFSLVGQVPTFIAQLFSFLPEWLIIFIAVSIGLVVAIGVVKLFLG